MLQNFFKISYGAFFSYNAKKARIEHALELSYIKIPRCRLMLSHKAYKKRIITENLRIRQLKGMTQRINLRILTLKLHQRQVFRYT